MTRMTDAWLRPTRGALDNAREATVTLALAVADRLALTDDVEGSEEDPGSLHAMNRAECYDVLRAGSVARLAYIARAGVPDIVPVNYAMDGDDLLIRTGPGPKLQAAERRDRVAIEVDVLDDAMHSGRSVVIAGRAERVHESDAALDPVPWATGPRRHLIRVRPTRVTGRRLS